MLTSQLTNGLTHVGWLPANSGLDLIEPGDACQNLGRERRLGGGIERVERPSRVGPRTPAGWPRRILSCFDQAAEPGIAIHLQGAPKCVQMRGWMLSKGSGAGPMSCPLHLPLNQLWRPTRIVLKRGDRLPDRPRALGNRHLFLSREDDAPR